VVAQATLSSRLRQVDLLVERRSVMPTRPDCDDDSSGGSKDRKAIIANSRKQRLFHFIDWWTFVRTIVVVEPCGV
jgi:hypothetical protein